MYASHKDLENVLILMPQIKGFHGLKVTALLRKPKTLMLKHAFMLVQEA